MHGVVFKHSGQSLRLGGTDNVTTTATATSAGLCRLTKDIIGGDVQWFFQKFYTALYLACFVVVFVLYVLIYRSVLARRVRRQRQKRATSTLVQTMTTAQRNDDLAAPSAGLTVDGDETMITMVPVTSRDDNVVEAEPSVTNGGSTKVKRWSLTTREKNRIANLKTAAILFVVTLVFVVTYLPAFLMTLMFIPYKMSVFYMYFANNIANPVIYSFMNKTFRDDLRKLYHRH
ncbi:hypothetical protein NP493_544g02015 [Ridgeia piscesae]|uniref:G-protein coupled receptors family 1 profile domain-containing protein n=1 Tax=Ridgeia piscesae TaxID=27915 RepID=A0AAD9NS01_RIDPI|nr:hypothetical protein NP493_544g02015 [Ridgeia piscesae]